MIFIVKIDEFMAKKEAVKTKNVKANRRQPIKKKETIEEITKHEKDKIFAMWAGVIFFMVLIFIFWLFTFRSTIETNSSVNQSEQFNWQEVKQEFSQTMQDVRGNLNEIKELREEFVAETKETQLSDEQIEELKKNILDKNIEEENIATSSEIIIHN